MEGRDKGKGRKYKKMLDAKAIPVHIVDMIEEQSKKQTKPREWKTKCINALFESDGKGGYVMKPHKPMFESHKEAYHKRFGLDEKEGMQKTVFLYKVFQGNEQGLERAIQEGGVQQWEEDGQQMCAFRRVRTGIEKASMQSQKVTSGSARLESSQFQVLSKAFSNMGWDFGNGQQSQVEAPGSSASASAPKPIENCGLTETMKSVMQDAKQAMERLQVSALKFIGKCSDDAAKKNFKSTVMEIKEWIAKDEHVLTWQARQPKSHGALLSHIPCVQSLSNIPLLFFNGIPSV